MHSSPPPSPPSASHLPAATTLKTCDDLAAEYLLFRGFTETAERLRRERGEGEEEGRNAAPAPAPSSPSSLYNSVLFSPSKLTSSIFSTLLPPTSLSLPSFTSLWSHLLSRFFLTVRCEGGADGGGAEGMERELMRMYVVACVEGGRRDLAVAFFDEAGEGGRRREEERREQQQPQQQQQQKQQEQRQKQPHSFGSRQSEEAAAASSSSSFAPSSPSSSSRPPLLPPPPSSSLDSTWRSWYALPFLPSPSLDPLFSPYFSPSFSANLRADLFNLLSSVISAVPVPRLVFLELWSRAPEQLAQRNLLAARTAALERATERALSAESETSLLAATTAGFVRLVTADVRESKRVTRGNRSKGDLFREDEDAERMREELLRGGEECERLAEEGGGGGGGRGEFVRAAGEYLERIAVINGGK